MSAIFSPALPDFCWLGMCYQPAGLLFPNRFHPWTALSNTQEWGNRAGVGGIPPPPPCWLLDVNNNSLSAFIITSFKKCNVFWFETQCL
jgi:hypothetical protein